MVAVKSGCRCVTLRIIPGEPAKERGIRMSRGRRPNRFYSTFDVPTAVLVWNLSTSRRIGKTFSSTQYMV